MTLFYNFDKFLRRGWCLLGLALLLSLTPRAWGQCFGPAQNLPVGVGPFSVAVGDFNADGNPDLATANQNSDNVSVLLGQGNGTFGAAQNLPVGDGPSSVAVGDFNADGQDDLATANQNSGNVSVLLGQGNGTFGSAQNFSVGNAPVSVAVGDFNADGKDDLASASAASDNVSVLLGQGNGSFDPAQNFPVSNGPFSVAVGDFNADGKDDLASANLNSDNVSVLLGQGNGTFGAAQNLPVGDGPRSVVVGDFNADGNPDLATANVNSDNVSVLLGQGDGTFGAAQNFAVGFNPISVAVGDFNADGKPDLAVVDFISEGRIGVLLGQGNGTFGLPQYFPVGNAPISVAVGDFNADGKDDLASANRFINNVSVLLSQTARFTRNPTVSGVPVCAGQAVTVNFSASGCGAGTLYTLQLSNASGSFANPTPLGSFPSGSSSVVIPASVPAGSGYRIRVVSPSGGAPSNVSSAFRVRACANNNPTRLAADPEYSGLQVVVSPNPTEGALRIHVSGAAGQSLKVELFNGTGHVLRQQGIEQAQSEESLSWDIARQPQGLYLLRVSSEKESKTVKVVH